MKKVKLFFNFLSAAGTVSGVFAVLFSRPALAPVTRRVPFFTRR